MVFVNGYTTPSAQQLKHLLSNVIYELYTLHPLKLTSLQYGGVFETYPSSRVTHIIASTLPLSTLKRLKGYVPIITHSLSYIIKVLGMNEL